jgi:uncharacterized membrane protein
MQSLTQSVLIPRSSSRARVNCDRVGLVKNAIGRNSRGHAVSQLVVTGFKDLYRASEVLNEMERRDYEWSAALEHAVVVTREESNGIKVQFRLGLSATEGSGWVRLWASFLSLALFAPSAELMVEAAGQANHQLRNRLPEVEWWKEPLGIPEEFVRDVDGMIQPGDSALFILLCTAELGILTRHLRNQGGTPMHTTLGPKQDQLLIEMFGIQ